MLTKGLYRILIAKTVHFMFRTFARCVVVEFAKVKLEFCESFARARCTYLLNLTYRDIFAKKCESSVKEQAKVKLHLERWGG